MNFILISDENTVTVKFCDMTFGIVYNKLSSSRFAIYSGTSNQNLSAVKVIHSSEMKNVMAL